jgi:hypothetical protein
LRRAADPPTIEDPDIFRAAKLMIDQHGEEAALQAAQRADHLLDDGDLKGSVVWRRIAAAIEELWRGRRKAESLQWSAVGAPDSPGAAWPDDHH